MASNLTKASTMRANMKLVCEIKIIYNAVLGVWQMISVEEALEKVLSYVEVLESERKPILDCLGQALAEDVYSAIDIPPLDNSAMDGYAWLDGAHHARGDDLKDTRRGQDPPRSSSSATRMHSSASVRVARGQPKLRRTKPSPSEPKAFPSLRAT